MVLFIYVQLPVCVAGVVSLATVFDWLRNALPQENLLGHETKTAARKTISSGIGGQVLLFFGSGANKVPRA